MKTYELKLILPSQQTEEKIQETAKEIESFIQKQKGLLAGERKSRAVSLGYEIKGNKHAVLISIKFQLNPDGLKELEAQLKKTPEILRHMIVYDPPIKFSAASQKPRRSRQAKETEKEKPKRKKVELKEIEKKLDEILEQ